MPRKSPVHYIAPSAVSIVPNANNTASDLAVYVARGTKVKVYSPGIKELGMVNETYQEWTLTGRNRRLADATKPYTLYARLSKTNKTDGYLVFAPMKDRNVGVEGEQPDWHDKYNYPTVEGMTDIDGALTDQNYWYIKLGEVGEPKDGQRTVDLDTGILTTDQYNMEWSTNPADMPLRVEIGCTIGDEDAGPTPYVPAGSQLVLTASLMRGWVDAAKEESFDHWEISRNTGDADADAAWPDNVRKEAFAESGSITITHVRGDGDDFRGLVAVPFTVTAMRRKAEPEPEPEPEPEENAENTENTEVTENTGEQDNAGESEGQEGGDEQPVTYESIASTSITIYAESAETYEIVLSDRKVVYNAETHTYTPEDGVTIRIRTTDQHGDAADITYGQLEIACLSLEYAVGSSAAWTDMDLGGPSDETVTTVIPVEVFAGLQNYDTVYVRLVRDADTSSQGSLGVAIELARQTIMYEVVQQQEPTTREREWIYLRSRMSITFGGATSANPEPALVAYGEENPEGTAGHVNQDKYKDHWVPEGWQMNDPGADSTWYYVYASWRDWVPASTDPETGEAVAAHWGDFIPARTWHQYNSGGGGEGLFISKLYNDVANGVITFLKGIKIGAQRLFGWDEDGNITARNVTADTFNVEKFTAHQSLMNEIYSDNFNWDYGMNGTGFILTKFGPNNHAFLALDDLVVRGKMTVNTLEIREETYTGGNQHWSPAGSIIFRVDYLDGDGEPLGFQTVAAPWLLNGQPFLTIENQQLSSIAYASRKEVRELVGQRISEVSKFRCYIVADNGSTTTRNFWCIGDQARCQTYNIVSRDKRDGEGDYAVGAVQTMDPLAGVPGSDGYDPEHPTESKTMENVYYWRLVVGVGTAKLEDGKTYNYIDLSNQNVEQGGLVINRTYAEGSDIPATGDTLVCFGNDSNTDRMGVVSIETYNSANETRTDQTPAIKMYGGINDFNMNGKRTAIFSPGLVEINSNIFRLTTYDGSVTPVTNQRGKWSSTEKYHYGDMVSHNGSNWLCIIDGDYYWVDGWVNENDPNYANRNLHYSASDSRTHLYKDGLLDAGEKGFEYSKGHLAGYRDHALRLIQTFVMGVEPSKNEPASLVWRWKGEAEAGPRGDFKSRVFIRSAVMPLTPANDTPQGTTYNTYDNPIPHPMSHVIGGQTVTETWSDGVPDDDFQLWSSICTFHGDGTKTDWSAPAPESDSQTQDIEFSAVENQQTTPYGDDATQKDSNAYKQQRHSQGWYDPSDTLPQDVKWKDMIWRAERQIKNDVYVGDWVVTRAKGEKGDPGELDPETKQEIIDEVSSLVESGLTLIIEPQVIIVSQASKGDSSNPAQLTPLTRTAKVRILRNGVSVKMELVPGSVSLVGSDGSTSCGTASGVVNKSRESSSDPWNYEFVVSLDSIRWAQNQTTQRYEYVDDNGLIGFTLRVYDNEDTGSPYQDYGLVVKWYLNRLGARTQEIEGDMEKTYMSRTEYSLDDQYNNLLLHTKDPQHYTSEDSDGRWISESSTNCTLVQEVSDTPVNGYTTAFRVTRNNSGYVWKQNHTFWRRDVTYKFSAYVRSTSLVSTFRISVKQGNYERFFNSDTVNEKWTYVQMPITMPDYVETYDQNTKALTSSAYFQMGSSLGTVEYIAPTIVDTTSASVLRSDYEGQIETSAKGVKEEFNTTLNNGYVTKQYMANYERTAEQNLSRVEAKIPGTNMVDYNGWEYYSGGLAETDESTQKIYGASSQNDFCSPAMFLKSGVTYVFSVYAATSPRLYYARCNGDPSEVGNTMSWTNLSANTAQDTYDNKSRYYISFTVPNGVNDYYKVEVYRVTEFYRPQFEVGSEPTAWVASGSKNYSSEIKQTADEINLKVDGIADETTEIKVTADAIRMGITTGWKKNYVVNPLATDGRVNIVTSSDIKSDNEFGQVVELANNGGDWQLNSVIDSSYEELTGKTVTWFCIVKAIERRNVSPYNCKLHFGTGANETIRNLHAIVMTATYTSATTPMTIEAVGNLNTSYYKDISYGQQKIGENGWYICWVSATPRSSSRTIIDGGDIYACGFNSMEGKWQIYYGGVVLGNECPSVDVIRESGNLKRTGIDIENGKVDVRADDFTVRNNKGEQTLGVDSDGNFEVSGTIKAYNLYRNLCIITGWQSEYTGSQSIYYSSNWYYCNGTSDETERYGYEEGKYYENPLTYDYMVQCTYAADIISLRNNAANDWPSGGIICIPRPQDFPGKTIEIRHNATNGGGSAVLRACDGSLAFADFQYSNQGVESLYGSAVVSQTVQSYDSMSLYSYKFGNKYYWRIVGLIHGGGITADVNNIHYEWGLAKRRL